MQKIEKRPGSYYSAELCEYSDKEIMMCPNSDACIKAHNRVEQLYRPEKYKTKFCTYYPNNLEKCDYGHFCSFAHSENDIAIELIHNYEFDEDFYMFHFKTVWCPFNLTQHDKALCVYAHNWQDYRRRADQVTYEPSPCSNWKSTDFILNYEDGCHFREKCIKCHGWKEHEYHPMNYKVKACPAGKNCQKGKDCPHYHSLRERRIVTPFIVNRIFRYVPRNRIVTNTFKVRSDDIQNQSLNSTQVSMFMSPMSASPYKMQFDQDLLNNPNLSGMTIGTPQKYAKTMIDLSGSSIEETPPKMPRRPSIELVGEMLDREAEENLPPNLQEQDIGVKQTHEKVKGWPTYQGESVQADNDRMYREIIFSPNLKEKKVLKMPPPRKSDKSLKEEKEAEMENPVHNILLEKILDN